MAYKPPGSGGAGPPPPPTHLAKNTLGNTSPFKGSTQGKVTNSKGNTSKPPIQRHYFGGYAPGATFGNLKGSTVAHKGAINNMPGSNKGLPPLSTRSSVISDVNADYRETHQGYLGLQRSRQQPSEQARTTTHNKTVTQQQGYAGKNQLRPNANPNAQTVAVVVTATGVGAYVGMAVRGGVAIVRSIFSLTPIPSGKPQPGKPPWENTPPTGPSRYQNIPPSRPLPGTPDYPSGPPPNIPDIFPDLPF